MNGPVLVHFWAMSCPACKACVPSIQALRAKYEPKGLKVIAIHLPRGEFDLDIEKVQAVAADLGVTEPCGVDNDHKISERFQTNGVWPTYFLFDENGGLKRRAGGGFGLKMCEAALRDLFGEV